MPHPAQTLTAFEDVVGGARFLWRLPAFLRRSVSAEDARVVLRGRLERREATRRRPSLHPRYRWSARAMRWGSVLPGVPLPPPRYAPIEAPHGQPRLRLLVHPLVGSLDDRLVAESFLGAISPESGVVRVMSLAWRGAGVVRVERRPPMATATGKILHRHVDRGTPGRAVTLSSV